MYIWIRGSSYPSYVVPWLTRTYVYMSVYGSDVEWNNQNGLKLKFNQSIILSTIS